MESLFIQMSFQMRCNQMSINLNFEKLTFMTGFVVQDHILVPEVYLLVSKSYIFVYFEKMLPKWQLLYLFSKSI